MQLLVNKQRPQRENNLVLSVYSMAEKLYFIYNKHQTTNKFKYLSSKQTLKEVCFEYWDFCSGYCLLFEIRSLGFRTPPNIEQLLSTSSPHKSRSKCIIFKGLSKSFCAPLSNLIIAFHFSPHLHLDETAAR